MKITVDFKVKVESGKLNAEHESHVVVDDLQVDLSRVAPLVEQLLEQVAAEVQRRK